MGTGMFRDGRYALVSYDGKVEIPITRVLYDERGYEPPFDQLPTREEYVAGKMLPERRASPPAGGEN